MKKPAFLIFTVFCLRILISCCDCFDSTTLWYRFDSVSTIHIDNAGPDPVYVQEGQILRMAYGIRLKLSIQQFASQNKMHLPGFHNSFATSCECPPEFLYLPQDTITDIRIITLNDFDAAHQAGDDISRYFAVNAYMTLENYLKRPAETYYEPVPEDYISLYLMQPPAGSGEYNFRAEITLSGGTILSATATPIYLL
jgi:hypothetical protein